MDICDCMFELNSAGEYVCRICKGDIYGCECPLIHTKKCEESNSAVTHDCSNGKCSDCPGEGEFIVAGEGRVILKCRHYCHPSGSSKISEEKKVLEVNRLMRVLDLTRSYKLVKKV